MPNFGIHRYTRLTRDLFDAAPAHKSVMAALADSLFASRPGLPAVKSSAYAGRNPNIGSTRPAAARILDSAPGDVGPGEIGFDPLHPAAALPGLPTIFAASRAVTVEEPLRLEVEGMPSLRLYLNDANHTVASLRRQSQYMEYIEMGDMAAMKVLAQSAFYMLKSMSQGPYSMRVLREMGHPYGYQYLKGDRTNIGRKVPRTRKGIGSIGHVRGIRGSVPDLTVVNRQSGNFERSWRWNFTFDTNGITLNFWNEAVSKDGFPYSWVLASGSRRMQAHGPWTYVMAKFMPQFDREWRAIAARGFRRKQQEDLLEATVKEGI